MSTNIEPEGPVSSVIAGLMGLHELEPQQPVQKRPRVLSENYLQKVASIGIREKCVDRHPFSLDIDEKNGHKDLFQASKIVKRGRHFFTSVEKGKSGSSSPEMKLTMKRPDAKHVSVNRKLQSSKKYYGRSEIIDVEMQNSVKYPYSPNLLVTRKHNEPAVTGQSPSRQVSRCKRNLFDLRNEVSPKSGTMNFHTPVSNVNFHSPVNNLRRSRSLLVEFNAT